MGKTYKYTFKASDHLLTGFVIIPMMALGQYLAAASLRFLTIDAFVLNRSSLVIPGLKKLYCEVNLALEKMICNRKPKL